MFIITQCTIELVCSTKLGRKCTQASCNKITKRTIHRFILYNVEITIVQIIICLSAATCYQNAANKIFIQRSMFQRSFFVTKGVNFIFSSFPESFRATQTIPDFASYRFIRNDTSFRVLTISCWRPVNIPPWWRMSHISFANHGQPIVVESLIPSNCSTTRVARMSAVIFLFVRFGFHSCRVVGHGFRAFCVILFFWGCSFGEI